MHSSQVHEPFLETIIIIMLKTGKKIKLCQKTTKVLKYQKTYHKTRKKRTKCAKKYKSDKYCVHVWDFKLFNDK